MASFNKAIPLFLCLSAMLLAGCSWFPHEHKWASVRPVTAGAGPAVDVEDQYYAGAVAAIDARDYAKALDMLQAARALKTQDVRVLNAFGVVYDKLGRFDLSTRYYAQAEAVDPSSAIVRSNLAYSQSLRGLAAEPQTDLPQLAEVSPAAAASPQPVVMQLAATNTPPVRLGLIGQPLDIADATGQRNAEVVRVALIRRGWSVAPVQGRPLPRAEQTVITYPVRNVVAARALARTLPASVRLIECSGTCSGIRLTLGADAAGWSQWAGVRPVSRRG